MSSQLEEAVDDFLAALGSERGLSRNTVAAYRRDLGQYLEHLAGSDAPDPDDVAAFVASLRDRDLASSTVARKLAAVRMFHRFQVQEGLADTDPANLIDSPKSRQSLPKALTIEQVVAMIETPDPTKPLGRRDRALLEFMYATGARVTETVDLDLLDVDLDAATAVVTGKGDRQRLVPLGSHAVRAISDYLPDRIQLQRRQQDALFLNARGRRLTRQGVWGIVRKNALRAGIAPASVSPHVFRHSAATHMVEGGADLRSIQQMLGHATITTTQVYTRVSPQHLLEVYATSHPRSR